MEYLIFKWVHILSSTLLFGTGLGSAFYMFFASRTRDPRVIAVVVRHVVIADWIFTTPTVLLQPLSGWYLVSLAGYPWTATWLRDSIVLYCFAIACWLPVVWMQIRMRNLANEAVIKSTPLPLEYYRLFSLWFSFGFPAFAAVATIFWLMIAKPSL